VSAIEEAARALLQVDPRDLPLPAVEAGDLLRRTREELDRRDAGEGEGLEETWPRVAPNTCMGASAALQAAAVQYRRIGHPSDAEVCEELAARLDRAMLRSGWPTLTEREVPPDGT